MAKENLHVNAKGYRDPTAHYTLRKEVLEEERFHKLLYAVFDIVDLAGFEIEDRITLIDKRTGRVWK